MRVLALGLGLVWLARAPIGAPPRWLWAWVALLGLSFAGAAWSLDRPAALAQSLDRLAIAVVLGLLIAAPARARRPIVLAGVAGLLVVAVWGLLQRFGIHPFMDRSVWEPSRPTRPLGTHNLMGGYLAAWLPAAVALALGGPGPGRLLGGVAALVGFACFLETESRGAWLALLVAGLVVPILWLTRGGARWLAQAPAAERRTRTRIALGLALGAVILAGISAGTLRARLTTREHSHALTPPDGDIGDIGAIADSAHATANAPANAPAAAPASALTSFERRSQVVQSALELLRQRPLLGWGSGSFRLAFYLVRPPAMQRLEAETGETAVHAHSDPLELGAELGLAGLLCAGLGLGLAGLRIVARVDPRGAAAGATESLRPGAGSQVAPALLDLGLAIGAAAILLHALLDFDLHEAPTALTACVVLGLLLVPDAEGRSRKRSPRPDQTRAARLPGAVRVVLGLVLVLGIGLALVVARSDRAYRRAYQVLERGDLAGSERWLRAALELVPDEARVWIARGEVARHRARLATTEPAKAAAGAEAIADFRQAAKIEPQIAARWQRLALVLQETMTEPTPTAALDLGLAVNRAHAANPLDPFNHELLRPLAQRAALPISTGPPESAEQARTALRRIADGQGWGAGLAARHLGDLASAGGRADEANSWYDRASSVGDSVEARAGAEGK